MVRLFAVLVVSSFLVSCANLSSISRTTDFSAKNSPDHTKIKAIHLDAKQRLAYMNDFGTVCTEPSPDALSAFASNVSGAFSSPSGKDVNFANSLSESSASIGLRTQTIQLLRDGMYRICELYQGRALDQVGVLVLQKNYQDVMLGMLAIEQLTGVIKADQVALSSNANGQSTNSVKNVEEALTAAKDAVKAQQEVVKVATETKATADTEAKAAQTKYEEALKESNKEDDANSESELLLKEERDKAAHKLELATANLDAQEALLASLEKHADLIEQHKGDITQLATSNTASNALLSGASSRTSMDAVTTTSVSNAVENIVTKVLAQKYEKSACISYMTTKADEIGELNGKVLSLSQVIRDMDKDLSETTAKIKDGKGTAELAEKQSALKRQLVSLREEKSIAKSTAEAFSTVLETCKGILDK